MLIADLHIHSKYSRATSRDCVPEALELWARRKGIHVVGTGDFTHPAWREELRAKLIPAEDGLYRLKDELRLPDAPDGAAHTPRFLVTGEISSIYKKDGKVRKVHNVILLPSLEDAEKLALRLEEIGNLHSDGRPILGLDSRDLLEITMDVCAQAIFIPAHIWTPHFSMFGAFSGFDTVEACFGDMTPYIHAVETGLSSDPPMNWRLSALDRFTLVSNSDAHSPQKLGREANLFNTPFSYAAMAAALERPDSEDFAGTIEFFPEEGKYHFDGHRNCRLCLKPSETLATDGRCPVCGKKLTIGVLHRVEDLADREEGCRPAHARPFESIVPLPEVIAASIGFTPASAKVQNRYSALLHHLGPEFTILREAPLEEIAHAAGPSVAEGIRRMRAGEVTLSPGYDGEYGKIHLLDEEEINTLSGQISLFGAPGPAPVKQQKPDAPKPKSKRASPKQAQAAPLPQNLLDGLNERQKAAVTAPEQAVIVTAGPGTGKTKTLVSRIAWLIGEQKVKPANITAVTFTNKAAAEMRQRLIQHFGGRRAIQGMRIGTFHALCLDLLSEDGQEILLVDENEAAALAAEILKEVELKLSPRKFLQEVSQVKSSVITTPPHPEAYERYCARLREYGARDFDDLLLDALQLDTAFPHLLVDEFQDSNEIQYQLVQKWCGGGKSVFLIGDPDQSIYGFRGSSARCFDRFAAEHPGARQIRFTENYRSTPEILGCALPLISHNDGPERQLTAMRPGGERVRLMAAEDDFSQALFLAKEINRMVGGIDMLDAETAASRRGGPLGFSDIAVLYRTHRQAELMEKCLGIEGVPYVVTGRDSFLADDMVRGTVGFFRYLLHPADLLSLRACLLTVLRCPANAAQKLLAYCRETEPGALLSNDLPAPLCAMPELQKVFDLLRQYAPRAAKEKPLKLLTSWAESAGLAEHAAVNRLLDAAVLQPDLASLLNSLSLGREGDVARSGNRAYTADAVTLSTLHGAKGLEFPVVFLCGVSKGVLPLDAPGRPADVQEERRLFFVGMTRAREELILLTNSEPSPFLAEIPAARLENGTAAELKRPQTVQQLHLF